MKISLGRQEKEEKFLKKKKVGNFLNPIIINTPKISETKRRKQQFSRKYHTHGEKFQYI